MCSFYFNCEKDITRQIVSNMVIFVLHTAVVKSQSMNFSGKAICISAYMQTQSQGPGLAGVCSKVLSSIPGYLHLPTFLYPLCLH